MQVGLTRAVVMFPSRLGGQGRARLEVWRKRNSNKVGSLLAIALEFDC